MSHTERKHKVRYTHVVRQTLDATGIFNVTFNLPFIPDEIKVKQVGFSNIGVVVVGVWSVNCDTLTSQSGVNNLGLLVDSGISFPGIIYPIGRSIDGTHVFRVLTTAGIPSVLLNGFTLMMHLEFRKWI